MTLPARLPPLTRVVEREARVFRRLWRASVFSTFLTPLLFLAAMGMGLGGLVDERSGDVAGLSYLHFVTPGLMAASAMQTAGAAGLWPVMAGTKWMRTFHAMVATPLSPADVYGGFVVWNTLRVGLYSTAFLLVATVLGGVSSPWAPLAVPAAALTAAAFLAPLAAYAATQEYELTFAVILRLGIMPLFLFSGTFFPIEVLPRPLELLSVLSPLWHGVELCRGATAGGLGVLPAAAHVAFLAAILALGWRWGTRTFATRLTL